MKKKPETTDKKITASGERFTAIVSNAKAYGLLTVHDFEGVKYQVVALAPVEGGVAVEFLRMQ